MRSLFRHTSPPRHRATGVLIPLVDMLTILLVAILRTASAEPALTPAEANFSLPSPISETEPSRGMTIEEGVQAMWVEGWRAGSSDYWQNAEAHLIPDILDAVQTAAPSHVQVQAHADAQWQLVGKVLFTVQQAGAQSVELIAVSKMSL